MKRHVHILTIDRASLDNYEKHGALGEQLFFLRLFLSNLTYENLLYSTVDGEVYFSEEYL